MLDNAKIAEMKCSQIRCVKTFGSGYRFALGNPYGDYHNRQVSAGSESKATELIKILPHRVRVLHDLNLLMVHKGFGFSTG